MDKQWKQILGITMVGEGMILVMNPSGHFKLWRFGPPSFLKLVDWCIERPEAMRALGAAETALGLLLASQQMESES